MMTDEELEKLTDEQIGQLRHYDQPSWWRAIEISEAKRNREKLRVSGKPTSLESTILAMSTEQLHTMTVEEMASHSDWKIDQLSRTVLDKLQINNREVYDFVVYLDRRRQMRKELATKAAAAAPGGAFVMRQDILNEFAKYFYTKKGTEKIAMTFCKSTIKVIKEAIRDPANKRLEALEQKSIGGTDTSSEPRIRALEDKTSGMAGASTVVDLEMKVLELQGKVDRQAQQLSAQTKLVAALQRRLDSMLAAQVAAKK